ncbi:hypothetical protein JCM10212_005547 [Sporobolomyces blumeae]
MSVTLSPSSQLGFQRPLTTLVKRTLSVSNHNQHAIAYKVKTTAPKQYCVRPNSGRIEPGETVEVQVLLQPMKEDPPAGTKCRDKFLVQSVVITPERENVALPELWQLVDKEKAAAGPGQVYEQKIRCTYLPAADEGQATIPEETPSKMDANTTTSQPDASFVSTINSASSREPTAPSTADETTGDVSYTSTPPPALGEPRFAIRPTEPSSSSSSSSAPAPPSKLDPSGPSSASDPNAYLDQAKDTASAAAAAATGAVAAGAAAVGLTGVARSLDKDHPAGATSTTADVDQLRRELATARAEIARLEAQLGSQSTLRNSSGATGTAAGGVDSKDVVGAAGASTKVAPMNGAGEGLSVQTMAGIFFASVLFTWLFRLFL